MATWERIELSNDVVATGFERGGVSLSSASTQSAFIGLTHDEMHTLCKWYMGKPPQPATDLLPLLRECLEIADSNWTWINREPPATRCQEDVDDAKQHYEKLKAAIERLERDG